MTRADIYRNLHTGGLSARHVGGRVFAHPDTAYLTLVVFVVQPAGRARVLLERRKCVHAFARGLYHPDTIVDTTGWRRATYNPYVADTFYDVDTNEPVHRADEAYVTPYGVRYRQA